MKLKWILTAWCLVFLLLAAPSHILAASLREPPATEQLGEVPAEKPGISPLAEGSVEQGAVWDFGSYITVKNTKGFDLPKTGDHGTWRYSLVGILTMSAAAGVIVLTTRKENGR